MRKMAMGLGILAILLITGCSDSNEDKYNESRDREAEATQSAEEINAAKDAEAVDTIMNGHPIDAVNGYIDANEKQAGYEAVVEEERNIQIDLVQQ